MERWTLVACALALSLWPARGSAFCGFYVGGSRDLKNDATQVVLMRQGRHTIMSIQNNYEGPPEDFALVVPVPVVLSRDDVQTLSPTIFDRVDQLASPRLVEYWEQDPCPQLDFGGQYADSIGFGSIGLGMRGTGRGAGSAYGRTVRPVVRVAARFAVHEYDVVILGADDSSELERWLHEHDYRIPRGAARLLRPYVEAGTSFLVARVDASRLDFQGRRAMLSPLRIHYESDTFSLPIRLGLLNARGAQDLIIHVLAPERYEVANRPNVTIPTNLRVAENVRSRFGTFYSALFDATVRENPGAVVTEYAWSPTNCDPCPGPTLSPGDISALGGDAVYRMRRARAGPPSLEIAGRIVSFAVPSADHERTQARVERVLRRGVRLFDDCVTRNAAAPGGATTGNLVGHLGLLLMPDMPPTVALAGEAPPAVMSCLRSVARRVVAAVEVDGPQRVSARINAAWRVVEPQTPHPPLTLSRMHYRYGRSDAPDDLVFRAARALSGGRGAPTTGGDLPSGGASARYGVSQFQGRYAILHRWPGAVTCTAPVRGVWGGRTGPSPTVTAASDLGEVRVRSLSLRRAILSSVPELHLDRRRTETSPPVGGVPVITARAPGFVVGSGPAMGCAVSVSQGSEGVPFVLLAALGLAFLRRRRP